MTPRCAGRGENAFRQRRNANASGATTFSRDLLGRELLFVSERTTFLPYLVFFC